MANYTEKHVIPTKGLLTENIPNGEVTLRNMTTAEEKILLGSSQDAFDNILKACIVEPTGLDLEELTSTDKHFLFMKLRVISYGSDYYVSYRCPACGSNSEYKVNIDELPIHYLEDDFVEPYDTLTLPVSKKVVELKLPRIKDLNVADNKAKRFHKKFPEAKGDIAYIYRLMTNIASVDGEELKPTALQNFVEELHTMDSSYLKSKINKLKIGYDTDIVEECPKCEEDIEFALPITFEFFRTRFED